MPARPPGAVEPRRSRSDTRRPRPRTRGTKRANRKPGHALTTADESRLTAGGPKRASTTAGECRKQATSPLPNQTGFTCPLHQSRAGTAWPHSATHPRRRGLPIAGLRIVPQLHNPHIEGGRRSGSLIRSARPRPHQHSNHPVRRPPNHTPGKSPMRTGRQESTGSNTGMRRALRPAGTLLATRVVSSHEECGSPHMITTGDSP